MTAVEQLDAAPGAPVAEITFSIGEAAAMIGVSTHTVRAWERRHRIVSPMRTPVGHRRYTTDDVELLRQVKLESRVHKLSMKVATMAAHGLVALDEPDPASASAATGGAQGADPLLLAVDLVSEIVLVLDPRGRIVHANTVFVRFAGVLPRHVRGAAFVDYVDAFDRAKAVKLYEAPLRQRRGWELNIRARRRRAMFSIDCWPVSSAGQRLLLLIGHDVGPEPRDDLG